MARVTTIIMLLLAGFMLEACGTTVHPGQRGLRWYPLGEGLTTEPLKSGFYWRAPWNDVFVYDVRWQSFTEKVDALSADDLPVLLHSAITMRPVDRELYFLAQELGPRWYQEVVKPLFLSSVRSVISNYPMVTIPEQSIEIGSKIEAVMVESLKGRHLEISTVALSEIELSKQVLQAVERKQAKEQEKEQKEFEVLIASRDAEIARILREGARRFDPHSIGGRGRRGEDSSARAGQSAGDDYKNSHRRLSPLQIVRQPKRKNGVVAGQSARTDPHQSGSGSRG